MFAFTNNATTTLAQALTDDPGDTTVFTADDAGFVGLVGGGIELRATLTNKALPDKIEIIGITEQSDTNQFVVTRAIEAVKNDQTPMAWPAGTQIECRITADMLQGLAQKSASGLVVAAGLKANGAYFGGDNTGGAVVSGYPTLRVPPVFPGYGDARFSREVIGGTQIVNLGVPQVWSAAQGYNAFSVVQPAVPDGYQYTFEATTRHGLTRATTSPFDGTGGLVDALGDMGYLEGVWRATESPVSIYQGMGNAQTRLFVVTEVGFLCFANTGGGAAPSVSIGSDVEPTRFANNLPLSQIADYGGVHRFPIAVGGAAVENIVFALKAATTGDFIGRFYWKGFFFEPKWWA